MNRVTTPSDDDQGKAVPAYRPRPTAARIVEYGAYLLLAFLVLCIAGFALWIGSLFLYRLGEALWHSTFHAPWIGPSNGT